MGPGAVSVNAIPDSKGVICIVKYKNGTGSCRTKLTRTYTVAWLEQR